MAAEHARGYWLRVLVGLFGSAIVLLGAIVLVLIVMINTEAGRGILARQAATLASKPTERVVTVGTVGGLWPRDIIVRDLSIADQEGVWLRIEEVRVQWRPLRALIGRIEIDRARVTGLHVLRRPVGSGEEQQDVRFSLPSYLLVRRMEMTRARLERPVIGQAAALDASGRVSVVAGTIDCSLDIRRDDQPGNLQFVGLVRPEGSEFDVRLSAFEPPGGLLASAIGRPEAGELSVTLEMVGSLNDLSVKLDAELMAVGTARGNASGGVGLGRSLRFAFGVRPDAANEKALAGWVGEAVNIEGRLTHGKDDSYSITDLLLAARTGRLAGDLMLGPKSNSNERWLKGKLIADLNTAALEENIEGLIVDDLRGDFVIGGTTEELRVDADIRAHEIGFGENSAGRVKLAGLLQRSSEKERAPWGLSIEGSAKSVSGEIIGAELVRDGFSTVLNVSGFDPDVGILIEEARVESTYLDVWASGNVRPNTREGVGKASVRMTDLGRLSSLSSSLKKGQAEFTLEVMSDGSSLIGPIALNLNGLEYAESRLGAIVGKRITGSAELIVDQSQEVEIADIVLIPHGESFDLLGRVRLSGTDSRSINGSAKLIAPRLSRFSGLLPARIAGAAEIGIEFGGELGQETFFPKVRMQDAVLADVPLGEIQLDGTIQRSGHEFSGPVELSVIGDAGKSDLSARFLGRSEEIALSDLSGNAFGLNVTGDIRRVSQSVEGNMTLEASDLSGLQPLLSQLTKKPDLSIQGAVTASVETGAKKFQAAIDAKGIAVMADDDTHFALNSANGTLSTTIEQRLEGELVLTAISAFGQSVDEAVLTATGLAEITEIELSAKGLNQSPASMNGNAGLSMTEKSVIIRALTISSPAGGVRLMEDAPISWGDRVSAGPFEISFLRGTQEADGKLTFSIAREQAGLRSEIRAREIDLDLVRLVFPLGPVAGSLEGFAVLDTRPGQELGNVEASLKARSRFAQGPDAQEIAWNVDAEWREASFLFDSQIGYAGKRMGVFSLDLPVRQSVPGAVPQLDLGRNLDGAFNYEGTLAPFTALMPGYDVDLSGTLTADLQVSGLANAPRIDGTMQVADGRLEHFGSGILIQQAQGQASFAHGQQSFVLTGQDTSGGEVQMAISLPSQTRLRDLQGQLNLSRFRVVQREEADITASGQMAIEPQMGGWLAKGEIEIDDGVIRVPRSLPPSIVVLPVRERDGSRAVQAATEKASVPIVLDVNVRTTNPVLVTGRGLRSTWAGNVSVGGTASDPRPVGELTLQEGTFKFGRRPFDVTRGRVRFDGGARINPKLVVRAEYETEADVTAVLSVAGTTSSPVVSVSSIPPLPRETVMALILFGKQPSELSTGELVQLAQALSQVSGAVGGGGNILSTFETTLGLDLLDVGLDPEAGLTGGGVSVMAGKRLTEDVFVSVRRGADPSSSRVSVDVDLTDHVSAATELRQDGESSVGVNWSLDY